jgi:hypothetical protein
MSCEFCGISGGGCMVCDHWCGSDADDPRAWEGDSASVALETFPGRTELEAESLYAILNIRANLTGRDCFPERVRDSIDRCNAALALAGYSGD